MSNDHVSGLIVCADLFWESPTLDLVRQNNIDTLLGMETKKF